MPADKRLSAVYSTATAVGIGVRYVHLYSCVASGKLALALACDVLRAVLHDCTYVCAMALADNPCAASRSPSPNIDSKTHEIDAMLEKLTTADSPLKARQRESSTMKAISKLGEVVQGARDSLARIGAADPLPKARVIGSSHQIGSFGAIGVVSSAFVSFTDQAQMNRALRSDCDLESTRKLPKEAFLRSQMTDLKNLRPGEYVEKHHVSVTSEIKNRTDG